MVWYSPGRQLLPWRQLPACVVSVFGLIERDAEGLVRGRYIPAGQQLAGGLRRVPILRRVQPGHGDHGVGQRLARIDESGEFVCDGQPGRDGAEAGGSLQEVDGPAPVTSRHQLLLHVLGKLPFVEMAQPFRVVLQLPDDGR